jgi:hypothetical protein
MARKTEVYKSADNGEFVSEDYAKKHPKTTYKTIVKKGPTKSRGK